MEEAFRTALLASSGVTALVPAGRINWGEHPQGAGSPYIHMMVVGDNEGLTQQGPDGLFQGRVQVDCYAPTYGQAKQVSRAVRAVLHGYRGDGFQLVTHVATRDSREGGANEAERLFRVSLDFTTAWRAT
jgi:hypothetical protein